MSDSDVETYKQIKSDLDLLRQSVEKSELWVYKSKGNDEHGKKMGQGEEEEDVTGRDSRSSSSKVIAAIGTIGKQGSAIDLDVGPPIHPEQAEEYKKIQLVCTFF